MSIIQEALRRAEMDVKAPGTSPNNNDNPKNTPESIQRPDVVVKKNKKKIVVNKATLMSLALVALMAFAVFSVRQYLVASKKVQGKPLVTAPVQDATYRPIIKTNTVTDSDLKLQEQPAQPANLKDITDYPGMTLNGIMYVEEEPRAIINNSIVGVGDLVTGAKVTKINPKNVVLEYNDVEITLNLK